jgi:DNA-binding response OmpR family regulator
LHKANHEGSDLITPNGLEIQVKARTVKEFHFSASTITFTNLEFDILTYFIFHMNGEIIQAGEIPKRKVELYSKINDSKYNLLVDYASNKIPDFKDITNDILKIIKD